MYEFLDVDVRWKRRGREAEKGMVLYAACDPGSIQQKKLFVLFYKEL